MIEMKAKSRLKRPPETPPEVSDAPATRTRPTPTPVLSKPLAQAAPTHHQTSRQTQPSSTFEWKKYVPYLPTLLLSLPFYFGVFYMVTKVYPAEVKDTLVPNSYLLFHLVFWIANYFLFSFVWLNSRRGFLSALLVGVLLFARMQSYVLPWQIILGLIGIFVIIELLLSGVQRISQALPADSLTPAPHRPRRRVVRKK